MIKRNDIKKNVLKWVSEEDYIECTFWERKYIRRVLKLAAHYPELVPMMKHNRDGSIFCQIPLKAIKLSIPTSKPSGVFGKMLYRGEV